MTPGLAIGSPSRRQHRTQTAVRPKDKLTRWRHYPEPKTGGRSGRIRASWNSMSYKATQMNGRLISVILLAFTVCVSCSAGQQAAPAALEDTHVTPSEEAVTEDACSSKGARELVERFLSAYSTGSSSSSLADRFFAPDDRFLWFHDALTRSGDVSADLSSLDAYFAQQHMSGDSMRLIDFSFHEYRTGDNTGHFEMELSRNEIVFGGKGVIDCGSDKIMAWASGPGPIMSPWVSSTPSPTRRRSLAATAT